MGRGKGRGTRAIRGKGEEDKKEERAKRGKEGGSGEGRQAGGEDFCMLGGYRSKA